MFCLDMIEEYYDIVSEYFDKLYGFMNILSYYLKTTAFVPWRIMLKEKMTSSSSLTFNKYGHFVVIIKF